MKDLQLFKFKGQDVRVVWSERKNDWYYVLVDTCKILQIGNPSDVVKRLLFPEGVDQIEVLTKGGVQKATCVSLPNYSDLISRSDTAPALAFRKWVWGEVIPTILQTGSYSLNGINFQDYEQIGHLDLQNDPELLRQAVEFYEDLMHAGSKKKTFLKGLEIEKYPENSYTRGKRKPMDIKLYKKQVGDKVQFGIAIVEKEKVVQKAFWGSDRSL